MKVIYNGTPDVRTFKEALSREIPELLERDSDVIYLDADLMSCIGTLKYARTHSDRAIDCGIAEANMAGMAAGLAAVGFKPIIHSFGPFASRRCYDQVFLSGGYAGNDITIGLKEDGSFVSSGGVSIPTDVKGVTGVSIANNAVYYVNKNGTVSSISLNGGSALATNSLSNVTMVSAGDSILAGLKKDGTVTVVSDSDDVKTTVSSWKNVQFIAAKGNTLIAITKNGKMYGVGDNSYNQYENTAKEEEKEDSKQLSSVKNIQFEVTTESLKISWDKVEHADSYEVIFNGGTPSLVKETSMTVGVSDLKDGESYSVSITAKTSDEKKYKDSDPTTTTYQYNAKTTQLVQPSGLNTTVDSGGSWTISWNSVENASYYIITLNGEQVDRIGGTSYTISKDALINNMNYTVGVRAGSDDSKYSESGETQVSTVYSAPSQKLQVTVHFVDADSGEAISDGASYTTTLDEGTYTGEELAQGHLSGYTVVEGQSFTIGADDNSSFNITVNVRPNSN